MTVRPTAEARLDVTVPVVIVGAGACGAVAALTARDAGADVLVLERDPVPQGSTALSSGMIPACGSRLQRERGVDDSPEIMAADIQKKARNEADPAIVEALCQVSGATIDWLADEKGLPLALVEGFLYPGHSRLRMHAPPSKTGAELIGGLTEALARDGIDLMTNARVAGLYADPDGRVTGLRLGRPDGSAEDIGCGALVLACNGFGGNPEMVKRYIPAMAEALYFGHTGNTGDAVEWGQALGAATRHMAAFQGHGSVAHPHNTLITWALMMEGGVQVNADGRRFSNEHLGYSEQAAAVLGQPDGVAWDIYDARLHELGMTFEDYRGAAETGAILSGDTPEALAEKAGLPPGALAETVAQARACAEGAEDPFGRDFSGAPALAPPFYAVKVTGALFHTQGGLVIDPAARVLRPDGRPLPNLFAGGGAACGVSGSADWGYLSGNGLLAAVMLGRIAGRSAARSVAKDAA
ncbi:MAG: FAD-dependent oxidoreductase [Alphaproteobacteria bacterium]|nr:FAD-dependent oxidoreductase [Alphaproteobacteria bacterium]